MPAQSHTAPRSWPRSWKVLLVVCLLVVGGVEAILLELGGTYFSGGFNHAHLDSGFLVAAFFAASLVVDAFLILSVWVVAIPVLRRLPMGHLTRFALVGVASLAVPIAFDLLRYRLFSVMGRLVSARTLWELAGGASVAATEAAMQLEGAIPVVVLGLVGLAVLIAATRSLERRGLGGERFAAPRVLPILAACGLLGVASAAALAVPGTGAQNVQAGLLAKPGGQWVLALAQRATDVDGDGFGLLARPDDPAPFDGSIHPFAVDQPGNQIDENGMAGDHPPGFEPTPVVAPLPPGDGQRPDVLLIFLESFRGDLVGRRLEGREITPFLNRLGREGASSQQAFVHTPYTVGSRAQFFGGRLDFRPGQTSLVDDFLERGYEVAIFSGQDDSLGGSQDYTGLERAHVRYSARDDAHLRTSRTANPTALQVSWKTLAERVEAFLEARTSDRPLLLYVNIVDTHFPYHHGEMDDVLGVTPVARHDISSDRADAVFATYANAAANVDLGIERVVEAWWKRIGKGSAILVTADHGQSFYENGVLGHGQFLDDSHTRVPFVLWGIGGDWPEPLGLADVRGLLSRSLAIPRDDTPPRARFVPDAERQIFQFGPRLERPRRLRLRALDGSVDYAVGAGRIEHVGSLAEADPATQEQMTERLIHTWESWHRRLVEEGPS